MQPTHPSKRIEHPIIPPLRRDQSESTSGDQNRDVTLAQAPTPTLNGLSHRQEVHLATEYEQFYQWLITNGRDPERNKGIIPESARITVYRVAQFHSWILLINDTRILDATHADGNRYEQALETDSVRQQNGRPYAEDSKRKLQQAVVKYFLWKAYCGTSTPWTPTIRFYQNEFDHVDYFTLKERELLYQAALSFDDLGKYSNLSPTARDRHKQYLAQKLGKKKNEVTPADFEKCRKSWKIPALISVSLDIGARPSDINRFLCSWYHPEKGVLIIPKEDSTKSDKQWEVGLSTRSVQAVDRWLEQRKTELKYDGSDQMWLNRKSNPYKSATLNHLLRRLLDHAGINREIRKLTWYSIRRSTGTYLTYFHSLAYAKEQLRHKSLHSTIQYVHIPVEARQTSLDQIAGANIGCDQLQNNLPPGLEERDHL